MDIYDNGKRVRLSDRDFLAEGGEGRLYAVNGRVFKIYRDPAKMIPPGKLDELGALEHPGIVRPLGAVRNEAGEPVGFSMARVPGDAVPLPRLFTSAYWNSHKVSPAKIAALVDRMRDTIAFIHRRGFLQVDGNEFNYMAGAGLNTVYFIDVDSYQTPSYPASAIMVSIQDYTRDGFSPETDWFSFAIVAFQLFTGIHPFKGRHPDFARNDFEGRIKAGISVLRGDVSYPSTVRDFRVIPPPYMRWFEALFIRGERGAPPAGNTSVRAVPPRRVVEDGTRLAIQLLRSFDDEIQDLRNLNGQRVIRAGDRLFAGNRAYDPPAAAGAIIMDDRGAPVFLAIEHGGLAVYDEGANRIGSALEGQKVFAAANVPYLINGDQLIELKLVSMGGRTVVAPGAVRGILPHATTVYDGLLVENVLGKTHLLLPAAPGVMPMVAVPELDGCRIVDARHERGVTMLSVAGGDGSYQRIRLRFSPGFARYDVELRDDVDDPLNFAVLDTGLLVTIPGDGVIEICSARPDSDALRVVRDPQVKSFMRIANDGGRLVFHAGRGIYAARLKA